MAVFRRCHVVWLGAVGLGPGPAVAQDYRLDPARTSVEFTVRHMGVLTVHGSFDTIAGAVHLQDAAGSGPVVEVVVQAASIDTDHSLRDRSLRSKAFFDVQRYPVITFHSTDVEPGDSGYSVAGLLVIRGDTSVIRFAAAVAADSSATAPPELRIEALFDLSRKRLGLHFDSTLDPLIGDRVSMRVSAVAVGDGANLP